MKLEINKMLTISTAHIKHEVVYALEEGMIDNITVYDKAAYGYIIYIHGYQDTGYQSLNDCIELALDNDCSILCLDQDGDIVKGLAVYDWDKEERNELGELELYKAYMWFDNGDSDEHYMIHGKDYDKARDCFLEQTKNEESFEYALEEVDSQSDIKEVFECKDVKSLDELYEKYGTDLFY